MGAGPEHEGSDPFSALTDPWTTTWEKTDPNRWRYPPAAIALGTVGLLIASGSVRQAAVMLALAAIVAAVLLVGSRPSTTGAAVRVVAVAAACVLARPSIGGRQVVLTVICVGLASLALGAWPDRRDAGRSAPRVNSLAVGPLAAAQVVVIRHGSDPLFVVLLVVAAAVLILVRVRPTAADRAERATAHGLRRLAAVVGAIILFPVVLIFLYLPGLLVRLAGAVRSGSSAGEPSPWQPYGVDLHDEQLDAARPFASTPRPLRVRRHLTGFALVAIVALLTGIVVVRAHRTSAPPAPQGFLDTRSTRPRTTEQATGARATPVKTPFAAEFSAPYSSLAPYRDVPWADALQREEGNDPEIDRRYVNVHDSVRASLPPPKCVCKRLKVWFAGGSAAFGYGQRDRHTIAADLVRMGAESGVSIDMENIGRAGITASVEVQQIRDRLEKEDPPDLIIFFDGFNDGLFLTAFNFGDSKGTDARAKLDGVGALEYITAHPDAYLRSRVGPAAAAEALAGYRAQRSQMEALARSRGIATAWFFQPDAFVSSLQLQGYQAVSHITPAEFMRSPLAVALRTMADQLAADGVTNLRPLFARYPRPVFLGLVHQSEEGAAITAEAIYDHLADQIRRLAS